MNEPTSLWLWLSPLWLALAARNNPAAEPARSLAVSTPVPDSQAWAGIGNGHGGSSHHEVSNRALSGRAIEPLAPAIRSAAGRSPRSALACCATSKSPTARP
jgi:hypothetical protein